MLLQLPRRLEKNDSWRVNKCVFDAIYKATMTP